MRFVLHQPEHTNTTTGIRRIGILSRIATTWLFGAHLGSGISRWLLSAFTALSLVFSFVRISASSGTAGRMKSAGGVGLDTHDIARSHLRQSCLRIVGSGAFHYDVSVRFVGLPPISGSISDHARRAVLLVFHRISFVWSLDPSPDTKNFPSKRRIPDILVIG
ncbi:hypothetical protein GQ607_000041 [Colletotrichum asianum]|uniref:Uncharacterized protein n=1 Tax=Colletotrichum asianum TaxID=702518 RepID=A0A8H3WT41_9PEZI|nr:hypothetical protein GQ607_000041 [Colletotrichum asianum]